MANQPLEALVYTNDNCVGCNKCISACPVLTANRAVEEKGKNKIIVDGSQCISCGACFDACAHDARSYYDDTERFFEDLKKGEKISLLLAPAFLANYPREYAAVLGGLKKLGVNRIISISFGADITTWGYVKYITEHNFTGGISQPCPAVVGYIEKYLPELLPSLMPVHSPMMCGAIYVKKYMKVPDKLAFISPCIAKKNEIDDPNCGGYVSYNVTFDHLMNTGGGKKHLGSIKEWKHGDVTENFGGRPNGVIRANDKIYVTHEGSRTEIFDAKSHQFITCIGNGSWGTGPSQTVHAFDVLLYKGLVMIHDKRYVNFVEEQAIQSGVTPRIYVRSEHLGETNGTYGMAVDEQTGLLYSTHPAKRIDLFAPDGIREGVSPKRTGQLAYKNVPYALDFYEGRMFVSSNGTEKFCEVNPQTGEIIKDHTTLGGITLQAPEKFCIRRHTLFITDRVKNGACVYAIPMSELK